MSKLIWAINTSLDGFADHTVGVAVDDELFGFYGDLFDNTDLIVFGRVTYQLMQSAWSNARELRGATERMIEFADKFSAIPKVVFSRTLDSAGWNNTRLLHEDMVKTVMTLKRQPGRNILVDGISIAQQFMKLGMIDEYWFVVHPFAAGKGRRLVENIGDGTVLKLLDTKTLKSGAVVLHYENAEGKV